MMSSSALSADLPAFLALAGPTASGKTAAALAIAQQQAVEIISVDSALVYRGMDIGTAKPSADELAVVPHHLINIRDPLKAYSAADFVRDARVLMTDIRSRDRLPLLVGGTMLYLKALVEGLDDLPLASPEIRAEIHTQAMQIGWSGMHTELALVDPVTAARVQPQDSQRISRALEVFRVSGRPMSFFQRRIAPTQPAMEADTAPAGLLISLEPDNRAWLHQRIAQRFDAMLAAGFLDEVRGLRARADLHPDLPAMRCVGYRQAWTLLDNLDNLKTPKEVQQAEHDFREQGIAATRQLAKRQLTWLRSMPQRRVVACDAPDALAQVLALTAQCAGATA